MRLPLLFGAAVLLLTMPKICADGVRAGLALCAHAAIPALFPFTVLSSLLSDAVHAQFPKAGAKASVLLSLMLGMLTGFPIGALSVISAYRRQRISKKTAEKWMGICTGTGPSFLVGYVGVGIYQNTALGWGLFIAQCASVMLTSLLFRCKIEAPCHALQAEDAKQPPASLFSEIGAAAAKMLSICGFIVFFSVLRAILAQLSVIGILSAHTAVVLGGILEMTGGIADAAAMAGRASLPLSAFFIGFGGICVLGQIGLFAQKEGLSLRWYFLQKILCGLFTMSAVLLLI